METQFCPGCSKDLLLIDFFPSVVGKNGAPCRACQRIRNRIYKQTHKKPRLVLQLNCQFCGEEFSQTQRVQGGGTKDKYCSKKCGYTAWAKKHPDKKRAATIRYENKPENQAKKAERNKIRALKKYGLTKDEFHLELQRQGFRCYGCLDPLVESSAMIDHDHETGKFRGLLCRSCNWGLGHLKDDPSVIRRLMAYLERDRQKILIYVAGALKNPRIPEIGNTLREAGYDAMDEWWTPGEHADTNWQAYEKIRGRSYAAALRGRSATNTYLFDKSYIDLSDVFILVMPGGKSSMLELGYASGLGKRSYLLLDNIEPDRYDIMPNAAYKVVNSIEEILGELQKDGI